MFPKFVFHILDEIPPELPLFGRGQLKETDTLFEWHSVRFWRFILVYRLND
jgi:hypothetical protein